MSQDNAVCDFCKEPIALRVITALGKSWHPEHFACKSCRQPITEETFNINAGEPVCAPCFAKHFSDTCTKCKQPIVERTIKAMNECWHEDCFVCSGKCQKPLVGSSFYERDGLPYCRADYEELFAVRCAGCGKPISENSIVALEAKWHRNCFKCKKCGLPISSSTFAVEDKKPLCPDCTNA